MLTAENLARSFRNGVNLFEQVRLAVAAGEYIAIIGESGVGKSTLLNIVAGLDRPDQGALKFDGTDLASLDDDALTLWRRKSLGFVFQAFHVLPYLDVAQNIALPLKLNGWDDAASAARVSEMLGAVGMPDKGKCLPRELSGGEMQRVAIARALAHRPHLVLADEPTGNLDSRTAATVLDLLAGEIRRNRAAGILVTHSPSAAATTDRVYELTRHGLMQRDR
jgi:putative ABC transport system ATP-binding protein